MKSRCWLTRCRWSIGPATGSIADCGGTLHPACQIVYQRTAYVGTCAASPLRLTLDRRVHGVLTDAWGVATLEGGLPLLPGQVIMEFKFRSSLPALLKALAAELRLRPSTVSKYRLCRQAWGTQSALREAVDA